MKPIEYLGNRFFDLMIVQPRETFYSTSLFLARAIVTLDMKGKSEEESVINRKHLKKLDYIVKNTHEDLMKPLAVVEAIVASKERSEWGKEYGGKNNRNEEVELKDGTKLYIMDLYRLMKESYGDCIMAVVDVVTEYSSDYRYAQPASDGVAWMGNDPNG